MLQEVSKAIELGSESLIQGLIYDALDAGDPPAVILNEDMIPAICAVFENYRLHAVTPSGLRSSVATLQKGIDALKPFLSMDCITAYGKNALSSLSDRHSALGKYLTKLVSDCLEPADRILPRFRHQIRRQNFLPLGAPPSLRTRRIGTLQSSGSPERVNI